jgi:HAD superfamily hydrolase (TIGR01509 family)
MKIQAVIFDLDGTLTEPFLNFDLIRRQMGLKAEDGGVLEALVQMPESERQRAEAILIAHEKNAAEHSVLNDGASHLVDKLRKRGISVGILTRNTRENAVYVTRKHGLHFDAMICREDGPAKPDGFGVCALCQHFGVVPEQTLVVGDFKHDLESARNAGAIAVLLKNHAKAETFQHLADYIILHLDEVLPIIDRLEHPL